MPEKDPSTIRSIFNSIAPYYDRTNLVMSFGLHNRWNRLLVKKMGLSNSLLDLCAGTGEIAYGMLRTNPQLARLYLLDFSKEMLDHAKEKAVKQALDMNRIIYMQGDAQAISLEPATVDAVTVAYGIRNVKEPLKCIQEAYRVLADGGKFGILELTRPKSSILRFMHSCYLKTVIPTLGALFAHNKEAYQYLCSSIHHFVDPVELRQQMLHTGFKHIEVYPIQNGIATILIGTKSSNSMGFIQKVKN